MNKIRDAVANGPWDATENVVLTALDKDVFSFVWGVTWNNIANNSRNVTDTVTDNAIYQVLEDE